MSSGLSPKRANTPCGQAEGPARGAGRLGRWVRDLEGWRVVITGAAAGVSRRSVVGRGAVAVAGVDRT